MAMALGLEWEPWLARVLGWEWAARLVVEWVQALVLAWALALAKGLAEV